MNNLPLVSTIMPTYNNEKYIAEAIEGILEQTYENWELIIVDDGSTDNTKNVIAEFNDPRIRYIYQTNKGRGAARNTALKHVRGKYIAIADSDDISLPNRFKKHVEFLENNPDIGVVGGQILHFNDESKPVRLSKQPTDMQEIRKKFEKGVMGIAHPACMIRAEIFKKVGNYCEECLRAQDLELFLRIFHFFKIANIEDDVLLYRNDPRKTDLTFWIRLSYYHEYANYRSKAIINHTESSSFKDFKKNVSVKSKIYTYYLLKYIKTTLLSVIKWK